MLSCLRPHHSWLAYIGSPWRRILSFSHRILSLSSSAKRNGNLRVNATREAWGHTMLRRVAAAMLLGSRVSPDGGRPSAPCAAEAALATGVAPWALASGAAGGADPSAGAVSAWPWLPSLCTGIAGPKRRRRNGGEHERIESQATQRMRLPSKSADCLHSLQSTAFSRVARCCGNAKCA